MTMTISCPTAAQLALRGVIPTYPPHSVEALTKGFLASINMSEQRVRELALAKQLPLSGIVRGLVLAKYPHIKEHWPKTVHSAAKIAGFAGRSRSPAVPLSEAMRHLLVYVNREETPQSTRRARDFLTANGATPNAYSGQLELPKNKAPMTPD